MHESDFSSALSNPPVREHEHSPGSKGLANLPQHRFLPVQRDMPDAVPGQHEIIFSWKIPIADILMVKQNMRMALPGQVDHPFGNVNAFHLEPVPGQHVDKAATAPAAYIESKAARATHWLAKRRARSSWGKLFD